MVPNGQLIADRGQQTATSLRLAFGWTNLSNGGL